MLSRNLSRRRFIFGAAGVAGAAFVPVAGHMAAAGTDASAAPGYGPLIPDPRGRLALPERFRYRIVSRFGDAMDDGLVVPAKSDGMHAFDIGGGRTALVRNHEVKDEWQLSAFARLSSAQRRKYAPDLYDSAAGAGGTTTIVLDRSSGRVTAQYLSLAGTMRNCAGGPTPWGTWISCEESVRRRGEGGAARDHGYNFEVSPTAGGLASPVPLTAMGRFNHEAVAVDPQTQVAYQTEDRPDGLLYRFIPEERGRYAAGGKLEAMRIVEAPGVFTGNWPGYGPQVPAHIALRVDWVPLEDIDAPDDGLRRQGRERGAARFARGEGMAVWRDPVRRTTRIWFMCTIGGSERKGQIWSYAPGPADDSDAERTGTLVLEVEPNDARLLDQGDNLTFAPNGDLIVCEDSARDQRLLGVTPEGGIYVIATNMPGDTEFAGATFSPDGRALYVNLQHAGLTVEITGPWET